MSKRPLDSPLKKHVIDGHVCHCLQASSGTRLFQWTVNALLFAGLVICACAGCGEHEVSDREESTSIDTQKRATDLAPVPSPNLDIVDEEVRQQIRRQRAMLDELLKQSNVPADKLATAFGELGNLYHTYELFEAAEACYRNARTLAPDAYRWAHYLGFLRQVNGRPQEAVIAFKAALAIEPNSVPTLVRLGETQLALNKPDLAKPPFQEALGQDASCVSAMVGLGRVALDSNDFARAVEYFETAAARQPQADATYYHLAMAHRKLGNMERAKAYLGKSGETAAKVADPLIAELRRLRKGARFHEKRGVNTGKAGNLATALEELRKAIAADPTSHTAHLNLGTALALSSDVDAAIEEYREALRLKPTFSQAQCNLAVLLAQKGSDEEALVHFHKALKLDPHSLDAHLGLADLLGRLGDHPAAVTHYARMIAINPAHKAARLGQAIALTRAGKHTEAAQRLKEARLVLPESLLLAHAMARLLAACPDDSVRDGAQALMLAEAVAKVRETEEHLATLAMAQAELGNFDLARQRQSQAITLAEQSQHTDLLPRLRENLALYEKRLPCRTPWPEEQRPEE